MSGYTLVSATILDPSGNVYAGARVTMTFIGQNMTPGAGPYLFGGNPTGVFQPVLSGQADSFGNFSALLPDNNQIQPTPSQWLFSIVAASGTPSFSVLITITGATQNITSALQVAAAPLLQTPRGAALVGGLTPVPFSATPAFNALNTSGFLMTLTGNVTSSTLTNLGVGQFVAFEFVQDATGGRTVVFPANVINPQAPDPTPNAKTFQLMWSPDGINLYPLGPATVN